MLGLVPEEPGPDVIAEQRELLSRLRLRWSEGRGERGAVAGSGRRVGGEAAA
jgi:hypothetical protein